MLPKDIIDQDIDENTVKVINDVRLMFQNLSFDWQRRVAPYSRDDYRHWMSPLTKKDEIELEKDMIEISEKSVNDVKAEGFVNAEGVFDDASYLKDFDLVVSEVTKRFTSGKRRDLDNFKEPVQFPLVFPVTKNINQSKLHFEYIYESEEEYMAKVWNKVFEAVNFKSLSNDDLKNGTFIFLKFDEPVELELAMVGLFGRKYEKHETYIEDQKRSGRCFSIENDTEDIENFICGHDGDNIFEQSNEINEVNNLIEKSMEFAWDLHDIKADDKKVVYRNFINSKLGRFCSFVSNVAEELADSLTKKLQPNQYIVKTLKHQECLILIANSDKKARSSYVFITFCFKKDWLEKSFTFPTNVFKHFFEVGNYYVTRFSSFNDAKLFNLARCEAIMFSISCYFQAANRIKYWKNDENIFSRNTDLHSKNVFEAKSMIKFSLVVLLHDKRYTDELLSLFRYAMLTGLQEKPLVPNPQKMFYKLNNNPRCRLQIWIINKLINASKKLITNGGFQRILPNNNNDDKTSYKNMFNPFNFNEIEDFDYLISLFYCGYLKNKNEKPEYNGKMGIYKNILEFENKLPKSYKYLSRGSFGIYSIERHNFSSRMLKHIIDNVKERLNIRYGAYWENSVVNAFLKDISTTTIDQFATLKMSSAFGSECYYSPENYRKTTQFKELFNIVGNDDVYISDLAVKSLYHIEKNGCLHVEVFQKSQHGGIREIYVLGIHERIVQHIIEALARSICELFCSEIITHPENKFNIPKNHYRAAETEFGVKYQTMAASCDAEKWNQTHYVSKFAFLLCRMTSNSQFLHPFIVRVLSYWKHKRIMIDPEILTYFDRIYGDIRCADNTTTAMFNAYKGKQQQRWAKISKVRYIETETGMMQGILNNTSSLLHTVLQEYLKSYITKFLALKLKKSYKREEKVLIDNQQSSDDSSLMISFNADTDSKIKENLFLSSLAFKIKANFGYLVGIWKSPKSIENCCFFMEFNSEYFFNGELYRPTLREIISSVLICETDSLYKRQVVMSTQLTDIIEGGGSYMLTAMCQIGQCLQFYRFLGSNFSPVFSVWIKKLLNFPDPGLGFFLMDNPLCAGLLGMKYNAWNLVLSNKTISSAYASIVDISMAKTKGKDKLSKLSAINGDDDWMLNPGDFSNQHDKSRIKRTFTELKEVPSFWREDLNKHLDLYYCDARNGFETRLKMLAKLDMINADKLLSISNSVVNSLIPDLYSLTRDIFCYSEFGCFVSKNNEQAKNGKNKISLSKLLDNCLKQNYQDEMSDRLMNQVFPHHKSFQEIRTCLKSLKYDLADAIEIPRRRKKELGEIIVTVDRTEPNSVSPMRILRRTWFERPNKNLEIIFSKMFGEMKMSYPWIKSRYSDSFREAPFSNPFHMANFFKKLEVEGRTISITGSAVLGNDILTNISNSVINDYSESHFLKIVPSISKSIYHCEPYKVLKHAVLMVINSFASYDAKLNLLIKISQNEELGLSKLTQYKKFNSLYALKRFLVCSDSELKIKQLLFDVKQYHLGYYGAFSVNCFTPYTASWIGKFGDQNVQIYVIRNDRKLKIGKVVLNDTDNFHVILKCLQIWAVDHKVANGLLTSFVAKPEKGERKVASILDFSVCDQVFYGAIICTTNRQILVGCCQPIRTFLKISKRNIHIMGVIETNGVLSNVNDSTDKTREITLLSYTTDMSDYLSDTSLLPKFSYLASGWRKWIRNEEFSATEIDTFKVRCLNLHENIDTINSLQIIKKAFNASLIRHDLSKRLFSDIDKTNREENPLYNENTEKNLKQLYRRTKSEILPENKRNLNTDFTIDVDSSVYLSCVKNKYVADVASYSVIFDGLVKAIVGYERDPDIFMDLIKCLSDQLPDDLFQKISDLVDISKAMETYCCISENSSEDPFSV